MNAIPSILHVDVLDTPEFFWEYPELEPLYIMTANYLDIETRVEVLNQRLDVIHELFEMLGNELQPSTFQPLRMDHHYTYCDGSGPDIARDVFRVI